MHKDPYTIFLICVAIKAFVLFVLYTAANSR